MIVRATNGYQALSVSQVLTILKHFPWHYLFKSLQQSYERYYYYSQFSEKKTKAIGSEVT